MDLGLYNVFFFLYFFYYWTVCGFIGRLLLSEIQPLLQNRTHKLQQLMDEHGLEELPETEELWEVPEPKIIQPLKQRT